MIDVKAEIKSVTVALDDMSVTVKWAYDANYKTYASGWERARLMDSVIYVDIKDESIAENLMNRRNRPHNEYRKIVRAVMNELEIDGKLSWSKNAGCKMCPCSPGFILTESTHPISRNFNVWVEIENSELKNNGTVTPLESYAFIGMNA